MCLYVLPTSRFISMASELPNRLIIRRVLAVARQVRSVKETLESRRLNWYRGPLFVGLRGIRELSAKTDEPDES